MAAHREIGLMQDLVSGTFTTCQCTEHMMNYVIQCIKYLTIKAEGCSQQSNTVPMQTEEGHMDEMLRALLMQFPQSVGYDKILVIIDKCNQP